MAAAAGEVCAAVQRAPVRALRDRIAELSIALTELYAAGLQLEAVPPRGLPPQPAPGSDRFPGLGSFDRALSLTSYLDPGALVIPASPSEAILRVAACAWGGLRHWQSGAPVAAVDAWAGTRAWWGPAALFALSVLREAEHGPPPEQPRRQAAPPEPVLLGSAPRGWVGIRLAPLGIGALVRDVAPGGPADGLIQPGDVLLSADSVPLDALDPAEIARQLVAEPGVGKTIEVYRDGASHHVTLISGVAPDPAS